MSPNARRPLPRDAHVGEGGAPRTDRALELVKQGIEYVRDNVDVDIDLDRAARGASAGYQARRAAGRVPAASGALAGALKSGGIKVRIREEPRRRT